MNISYFYLNFLNHTIWKLLLNLTLIANIFFFYYTNIFLNERCIDKYHFETVDINKRTKKKI